MYLLKVISSLGLHWLPTLDGVWVIISEDSTVKVSIFINNWPTKFYSRRMRYLIRFACSKA